MNINFEPIGGIGVGFGIVIVIGIILVIKVIMEEAKEVRESSNN